MDDIHCAAPFAILEIPPSEGNETGLRGVRRRFDVDGHAIPTHEDEPNLERSDLRDLVQHHASAEIAGDATEAERWQDWTP